MGSTHDRHSVPRGKLRPPRDFLFLQKVNKINFVHISGRSKPLDIVKIVNFKFEKKWGSRPPPLIHRPLILKSPRMTNWVDRREALGQNCSMAQTLLPCLKLHIFRLEWSVSSNVSNYNCSLLTTKFKWLIK